MLFFSVFVICLLIGVPIAFSMGLAGLIYLPFNGVPVIAIVQRIFGGLDSFTLLAVPLYLLVGEIMEKGGISMRIINFADSLVGHIRGGLGHVVVVTTYIMSGISGSTTADTAAVGSVMIPSMERKGYGRVAATAIVAAAGGMDILIPPCITMIILGTVCGLSIGNLFFAGIIPAAVMAIALMIVIYINAKKENIPLQPRKTLRHVGKTFNDAFLALLIPFIILGGIKIGIFTATEGAVAAAIYAAIVAVFFYREVKLKDWKGILLRAATATAQIELLIAMASLLAWVTARERLPDMLLQLILGISDSPYVFLFFVNIIFLLFGAVLEGSPAIIILAPLFMPVAVKLGLDPIYFGTVLMANLGVGFILPPVGLALLVATSVGKITIAQLSKPIMPYFLALVIAMLLITYVPDIALALPKMFGYKPIGSFVSVF
jgi:C4-dicarboxylate transporter, DctM subunit